MDYKEIKQLTVCVFIIISATILALNKVIDGIIMSNIISIILGYVFAGAKQEYTKSLDKKIKDTIDKKKK